MLYYHSRQSVNRDLHPSQGRPIADLAEDIAAEEKVRATYQWLINLTDDPDVIEVLKFLREREVVHSQRFREALYLVERALQHTQIFLTRRDTMLHRHESYDSYGYSHARPASQSDVSVIVGPTDAPRVSVNVPPVKPYPPDPYIDQFTLPEGLRAGTLFRWLYHPYVDPYRG